MTMKLLKINEKNIPKYLFIFSLVVMLILGLSLSYNFDFSKNLNLLFESDTARVIRDMTLYEIPHIRTNVHPLFVIISEPVFFLVKAIFIDDMLSLVVISSIVSSLTVLYIYKILSLYGRTLSLKVMICLCYLFSFANYVFTAGIELYNIAVLFLVLLWYYVLRRYPEGQYDKTACFILTALGMMTFAITITNYVIFLIIVFFLLIFKRINLKQALLVGFVAIIIGLNISNLEHILWSNTQSLNPTSYEKEGDYINFKITGKKIVNVLKNDYYYSLIGNDMHVLSNDNQTYMGNNYVITFNDNNNYLLIGIVSVFYILLITLAIRNYKKHLFVNLCLTSAILYNTILHIIYGNIAPFLYSMHFLYLFYLSFGINLMYEENKKLIKISKIYLSVLLALQLVFNNCFFAKIINIVKSILPCNYYVANFDVLPTMFFLIIIMALIAVIICFIIYFFKKFKLAKTKEGKLKYGIIMAALIIAIQSICISLEANEANNVFLMKKINSNSNDIYVDLNKYLKKDNENLYNHFKEEVALYNEYKNEYNKLLKKYKPKKVSFVNHENYYFFGLGNRRKLMFRNNGLIDVTTGKTLYFWNVKDSLIIPNGYMVIIETTKEEYIKIYEDNTGVHYNVNGIDMIIEGTNINLNLYQFENQKWSNTKKVLYSEILFNIKYSKIYPNILVYDNPWYRDAAMGSMVLKITGNTDLISDWVKNITEVYDKQNNGVMEPDNLGELLYIISTQETVNEALIAKIEAEAESLAKKNLDGNYLIGMTDFSVKPLYQNLWYQCGMNALKKNFSYDTKNLSDEYGLLTWWMDNKVTNKNNFSANINFPYLSYAAYHKLHKGSFPMNSGLYPLSWEKGASGANYSGMQVLDNYYVSERLSPLHTWSASELLLLLLNEEKELNLCYN